MIHKLLLAKYQYLTATRLFDPAVSMSGGVALSLLQDAVETMAWAVAIEVDAQSKDNTPFTGLWELVKAGRKNPEKKELPLPTMMQELNKIRVNFKHYGVIPELKDSQRYFVHVEEFLRQTMATFFHQDFDSVSLAALVREAVVRDKIREAEGHLESNDFQAAVNAAAVAESLAMRPFERLLPRVERGLDEVASHVPLHYQRLAHNAAKYIADYMSALRRTTILGLAGHKIESYNRFYRLTPSVHCMGDGTHSFASRSGYMGRGAASPTREDADFCIRYVTEFAISIEDRLA